MAVTARNGMLGNESRKVPNFLKENDKKLICIYKLESFLNKKNNFSTCSRHGNRGPTDSHSEPHRQRLE